MSDTNYFAATRWTPSDVQTLRPFWSLERCERWLEANEKHIADRLVELGWDVMGTLLDPAGDAYVIYSANEAATAPDSSNAGFWSNEDGWGAFASATIFDDEEQKTFNLPLAAGQDARWLKLADAEKQFGRHPRNLDGDDEASSDDLPKIMARFVPQAEINRGKSIIEIDGARDIDVTAKVLGLTMSEIVMLDDDQKESDELVDLEQLGHSGPFRVEIVEAVKAFFGVEDLSEIDDDALERERALRGIDGEYKLIVVYALSDPEKMASLDKVIEESVGRELCSAGSFLVGNPQRDLEFRFDSRAEAQAALTKVEQLEAERKLGIEASVAVA